MGAAANTLAPGGGRQTVYPLGESDAGGIRVAQTRPYRVQLVDLSREVERRLDETLAELERVIARPRPAAATLHRLHRDLRRLRVGVEVWRRVATRAVRQELKLFDRRLKRLARVVGGVRDRDVTLDLLGRIDRPPDPKEKVRLHRLRSRLSDDARTGREVLRMYLVAERDGGLFEGIRAGLHARPSGRKVGDLRAYLGEVGERERAAIRSAHRKARRRPSARRLHQLRLRVRAWGHLTDLASTIGPARPMTVHRPLRTLQQRLGRLHDLDIATDLARPALGSAWAAALRQERRHLRRRLVRELRKHRSTELVPPSDREA
jgi:CHAD domain-containing protein